MNYSKILALLSVLLVGSSFCYAQCADSTKIYSFSYDGHDYDVFKENKSWTDAVACALMRNGYLAEITSQGEQNAIFNELTNNAGINPSNTQNQFGTGSIWLGGSDAITEGSWIWDGNNDGNGPQFWSGGPNGTAIGGYYTNWGISPAEPDNSGGQDHLTMILKPTATNFGLWNDLVATNQIYYLIEYNTNLASQELNLEESISIYPNPFNDYLRIENFSAIDIDQLQIVNLQGKLIMSLDPTNLNYDELDVSSLESGIYFIKVQFNIGRVISQMIMK